MKKPHKIIMLPTDKSNIGYRKDYPEQPLFIRDEPLITSNTNTWQAIHLYIISDEEIKEGDWFVSGMQNYLFKADSNYILNPAEEDMSNHRKILATTDKALTWEHDDTVPIPKIKLTSVKLIPQQFLEDFCKAGGIWEVELEYEEAFIHNYELKDKKSNLGHKFKITSNNEVIIHLIEENEIDKLFNWLSDRDYLSDDISVLKTEYINWIKENL